MRGGGREIRSQIQDLGLQEAALRSFLRRAASRGLDLLIVHVYVCVCVCVCVRVRMYVRVCVCVCVYVSVYS